LGEFKRFFAESFNLEECQKEMYFQLKSEDIDPDFKEEPEKPVEENNDETEKKS
jgi:hypothetical protein